MVQARPDVQDFDAFLAAFPWALDKGLPWRHWQRDTLGSSEARTRWVEPDILALAW